MYQTSLIPLWNKNYLPDEVIELQYQWTKAVDNRLTYEATHEPAFYELSQGVLHSVFLCEEYAEMRDIEMQIFCCLADYGENYPVFEDNAVKKYLYL